MLTLAAARALLESSIGVESVEPLAGALGFGPSARMDDDLREQLGIPISVVEARLAAGPGTLRMLLLELPASAPSRIILTEVADAVSRKSPHLLWTCVATRAASETTVCAWTPRDRHARISALVVTARSISESDVQTLCALAAAGSGADILAHSRWLEILGREAITLRFFRTLQGIIAAMAASVRPRVEERDASDLALLNVSRLLFLSFLEAKGWLNGDFEFLTNQYVECVNSGGRFHERVMNPLFFGTLNTVKRKRAPRARSFGSIPFLNGGMFARTPLEKRVGRVFFDDDSLGEVFGDLLTRYRFTPREEIRGWSETAIDPEILGRAFETLMATRDRKATGAFYTPQRLVEDVTRESLERALCAAGMSAETASRFLMGETCPPSECADAQQIISSMRVLDPACGSGAFLVHVLERLASLRALCGDARPVSDRRRDALAASIFGVDSNPAAVWLCELRLWLSVVIENSEVDPAVITPLPNLDRNIRVGDSLGRGETPFAAGTGAARHRRLRLRYMRATGSRKLSLARALDRAERDSAREAIDRRITNAVATRREILAVIRSRDLFGKRQGESVELRRALTLARNALSDARNELKQLRAGRALSFSFATHFPEAAAGGGFDLVVGNPPWVRLHHIPRGSRENLRAGFAVYRNACWRSGARQASAGTGFGAQVDLAALFIERSLSLARPGGTISLLVPAKLWRSLAGGGVRDHLLRESQVEILEDYSDSRSSFDAAVYPSLLIARRNAVSGNSSAPSMRAAVHRRDTALRWTMGTDSLAFDDTPGSPWILVPPEVRAAFECVRNRGVPLAESRIGRPLLGVKCGCNDAFLARFVRHTDTGTVVEAGGRIEKVETDYLRPVARGDSVTAWKVQTGDNLVIWPYRSDGSLLEELPPGVGRWLRPWRSKLESRSDGRRSSAWWKLFRTECADGASPRVIWSDFGRRPRAAALRAMDRTVPLNSCYGVRCESDAEALALAAILNSPVSAAWLRLLAEPARGGYSRFLGWTMSLLPLPSRWNDAVETLSRFACSVDREDGRALLLATLAAYGLRESDVEPLLLWAFPH